VEHSLLSVRLAGQMHNSLADKVHGHSQTGAANAWDLLSALFVESIKLGYAPEVEGWRAEMTPVDFVSKAIVHLASQTHAEQTNRSQALAAPVWLWPLMVPAR
jgi:thioester reductase-like protein